MITFTEVKRIAKDRGCKAVMGKKAFLCEISWHGRTETCIARGGTVWYPPDVFRACRAVKQKVGERPIKSSRPEGLAPTKCGLDEELIAEALAADGVRPYLGVRRTIALEAVLFSARRRRTLDYANINMRMQAAVRAVRDAGLADLEMGPDGGWSCARLIWKQHVLLNPPVVLTAEDDAAIELLARTDK